ncbi:MAG: kinase/pyrophosphorylase [Alphaproteobacteria bacterium]|nr:kinase/pyrophosphorylase [Alphaproteobacteria bacterium]NCQ88458.1 kinase/pyrophosphorylase [Alphaproteobacteria bacterium]NCT06001.1 kinase/pyrophosphorylase [Alphaproteobacteria bacterium]
MTVKNIKDPVQSFHIYLVSDATGTTLQGLARAALSQFDSVEPTERFWPMIRSEAQLDRAIADIQTSPGPVLFTFVDKKLRRKLQNACSELDVPCMPVLDPILRTMSSYLGLPPKGIPGLQHALDEAYFKRMDAVDYALNFDDGQHIDGLEDADVILVGVSRTSKTPTCIFLARCGIKAANVPLVPGVQFPEKLLSLKKPLFVGLTESPKRLENLRRSRLNADDDHKMYSENEYLDLERIEEEIRNARRLFSKNKWPVIDVTRRSVEETTAEIIVLLNKRNSKAKKEENHDPV